MRKNLLSLFAFACCGLVFGTSSAKAMGGLFNKCSKPCEVTWEERKVTCYKTVTKEKEIEVTVCKAEWKEEVRKKTCTVCTPVWTEEKRTCTVNKRVAKEVEKEVTRCVRVPVTCCDPCTGRVRTRCEKKLVTEKVKCTVWECVPEKKEYTVKVCTMKKEEKTTEYKVRVCEMKQVKEKRKVQYCERVPYETTIKVCVRKPVECKPVVACKLACEKKDCCKGLKLGGRLCSRNTCCK